MGAAPPATSHTGARRTSAMSFRYVDSKFDAGKPIAITLCRQAPRAAL